MKITLRIARTELASLFYSPIAWFILIVFSFLTAMSFTSEIESTLSYLDVYGYSYNSSQTFDTFLGTYGFLATIVGNLYIYIPLLTMGLLSRETASGSIKLLYSSPVTSMQIVGGKYLAAIGFGLCMMLVPAACAVCGSCIIPHFDWPPVLVGLLGLYLLMAAYCAVGLFLSSLTSYQVVAAVGTLITLAVLKFVGNVGQQYDFIRELTYWLSINGRTTDMLAGVIRSEDLIYFLAVILLFLAFTVFRITFSRSSAGKLRQALSYLGVFAAVLAAGYLTSRPAAVRVWDTTRTRLNSICENSQKVLAEIDGPLTITNYVNLLDNASVPYLPLSMKQNETIFDPYMRFKPDLKVKYVYYYDGTPVSWSNPRFQGKSVEELRDYMAMIYNLNPRLFKSPEEIRRIEDLSGEEFRFVRIARTADGREAFIRDFNDMQRRPGEAEITAALKKMISTPPLVGFVRGHGERSMTRPADRDYTDFTIAKYSRSALVNQGFDVCEVDLSTHEGVPGAIRILVLADMKSPLTDEEAQHLDNYLERGGNLMILCDAGRQQAMNPLIARFGLRMEEHQLAQPFGDFYPDLILARATPESAALGEGFRTDFPKYGLRVTMPGCVALTVCGDTGYRLTPLLQTDSTAWIEREQRNLREAPVTCNPEAGEHRGVYRTAYAAERETNGRRQRILVTGDADCMSNAELSSQREGFAPGNFNLIVEGFRWLTDGNFPIEIRRPECPDDRFSASAEIAGTLKTIFLIILPAVLLLTGVGLWLARRRN